MDQWPHHPDVWRMDLYWQNHPQNVTTTDRNESSSPFIFHMDNQMYPGQTWNWTETKTKREQPSPGSATLKTRAVMWGTEAHENWYLLDYQPEWKTMMVYYCAYTEAVDRFDSMAMVLQRLDDNGDDKDPLNRLHAAPGLTLEQEEYYERRAKVLLGDFDGNLQRIPECFDKS